MYHRRRERPLQDGSDRRPLVPFEGIAFPLVVGAVSRTDAVEMVASLDFWRGPSLKGIQRGRAAVAYFVGEWEMYARQAITMTETTGVHFVIVDGSLLTVTIE